MTAGRIKELADRLEMKGPDAGIAAFANAADLLRVLADIAERCSQPMSLANDERDNWAVWSAGVSDERCEIAALISGAGDEAGR